MLVAIFGTGRNGSTLLMRLLDGIEELYMHPVEVNFLSALNDIACFRKIKRDTALNCTTKPLLFLEKKIETKLLLKYYKFHEQIILNYVANLRDEIFLGEPPFTNMKKDSYLPKEFVIAFLQSMSKWINNGNISRHFGFKTIETPYIPYYESEFPDMKFIHLIRNPIDMYSSAKRTTMYNKRYPSWYFCGDNLISLIDKRWIPHAEKIIEKCPSEKHFLVRYEDLIYEPEKIINEICSWLGLPLPSYPVYQTVLGGRFMKELPPNLSKKGVKTPFHVTSELHKKFKYENVLTKSERDLIIYKTFLLAKKLGYYEEIEKNINTKNLIKEWIWLKKFEFENINCILDVLKSLYYFIKRRLSIFCAVFKKVIKKAR